MKVTKKVLNILAIIFGLISIGFWIYALVTEKCNPWAGIFLAITLILVAIDGLLEPKKVKINAENQETNHENN